MEELTELIQKLWRDGYLPKSAYAELMNFTNTHESLQLLQPDVSISVDHAEKYAKHQFNRGVLGYDFIEFKEWQH